MGTEKGEKVIVPITGEINLMLVLALFPLARMSPVVFFLI